jgi:hypothetical protein
MDKKLILEAFVRHGSPLKPDDLRAKCLHEYARTSVYAYLLRLRRQKLVERTYLGQRLAYRITSRGIARLEYFRRKCQWI